MSEIPRHIVIFTDELHIALAGKQPCLTCRTPLGVLVQLGGGDKPGEEPGEWDVITPHDPDCPAAPSRGPRPLRIVKEADR